MSALVLAKQQNQFATVVKAQYCVFKVHVIVLNGITNAHQATIDKGKACTVDFMPAVLLCTKKFHRQTMLEK